MSRPFDEPAPDSKGKRSIQEIWALKHQHELWEAHHEAVSRMSREQRSSTDALHERMQGTGSPKP